MLNVNAALDTAKLTSKFRGCLIGALLGDCLGVPFEGESSVSKIVLQNFFNKLSGPYFKSPYHQYSDDTAMTKGLAQSLIENNGFDEKHMAKTFVNNYFKEPKRGYGHNVVDVFCKLKSQKYKDVWRPAQEQFDGTGSYGNGGAMRIAPVALFCYNNYNDMISLAKKSTNLTHTHSQGVNGAILQCIAIYLSLLMDPLKPLDAEKFTKELMDKIKVIEKESEESDSVEALPYVKQLGKMDCLLKKEELFEGEVEETLGNSIAALYSVPTAIFCFLRAQKPISSIETDCPFRRTIQFAISLGGDTDTIASMAGAIAGAFYGIEVVNANLLKHCERAEEMKALADQLLSPNVSS
uniref:ADP-ribosylhydrolase ARH3 n=1 Tax=Clastoptera arizonana TaxID=38151 RepID=A0A1B6CBF3_9HEMI